MASVADAKARALEVAMRLAAKLGHASPAASGSAFTGSNDCQFTHAPYLPTS